MKYKKKKYNMATWNDGMMENEWRTRMKMETVQEE